MQLWMKNEILDDKKALEWKIEIGFTGFLAEIIATTMKEVHNQQ